MRPSLLLLAVCLLGSIVAALAWFAADGAMPSPDGNQPAAVEATATDGDRSPEATVAADLDRRDAANPVPLPGVGEPTEDDERAEVALDQRSSPRVLVVRGDPPTPVPGAVVFFVTESQARDKLAKKPPPGAGQLRRWDWPSTLGQSATTGDDGSCMLPVAPEPWLCSAQVGAEFGFLVVPPRDRTHTLQLITDETVTLQTRGEDGKAVPMLPLAIVQQVGQPEAQILWEGDADRTGKAVVRHFQYVRQNRGNPDGELFAAMAKVPFATSVTFVGRPAATTPVELPVAPLASILVTLADHRGTPLLSRASVQLTGVRPVQVGTSPLRVPAGINAQRIDKPPGDAPVVLPWHELGIPLSLSAVFPAVRRQHLAGPFEAPTEPGQKVPVTMPLGRDHCVLAGRLALASDTGPAAWLPGLVPVAAALWRSDRDLFETTLDPLPDGRFDCVLTQRTDATEFWLELRLDPRHLPPVAEGEPPPRYGARVRLPALRGGERLELGTVVLGELPALVSGLIVDDEGKPVADADVQVQVHVPPAGDERNPRENWRPMALLRTRSFADGTFRVDGPLPFGSLRVRADTDQHFADSVPLHSQGQVVRIKIDRNGVLRGRVTLPDWVADGMVSLQLRPFDEAMRARDTRSIELSARRGGGRFTIEPLRPGRYDALVLLRNVKEPLAVLQDVFVVPGETRDRRFRPLDLSMSLHRFRLRAVDQSGQPFGLDGPIIARLPKSDGTFLEEGFRWQKGRAELITGSPLADLVFFGRGHRTVRTTLAAGDHDVMLPTSRPALVELPGLRALCGPQRKVRISVVLQGDTGLPASFGGVDQRSGERFGFARWDLGRSSGGWLGYTDTVEIPLLQSGKYQVLLRPHATDTERSLQGQLDLGVHELNVDGGYQPVRVALDPVAVGNMLQQLDQNQAAAQDRNRGNGNGNGNGNGGNNRRVDTGR